MECYLAIEMNELLIHETVWMDLKGIIPENTYCMIPLKWNSEKGKSIETEKVGGHQALGVEDYRIIELTTNSHEGTFFGNGNVLYLDGSVGWMIVYL